MQDFHVCSFCTTPDRFTRPEPDLKTQAHVAIVIVSWNGCDHVLECLASVGALTYGNRSTIVVDQASSDGTTKAVKAAFPGVEIVESQTNDGFSGGANRGIRCALANGAAFVLLLNSDVTVAPDMLENLIGSMTADSRIAVAGPLMLKYEAPEIVWSAGGMIGPRGESIMTGQGTTASAFSPSIEDLDFVVGCGMLLRMSAIERSGLFDERFFLYYEEADICARIRAAGERVVTVSTARLWHKSPPSDGTAADRTLYYMRRNALLYLAQNANRPVCSVIRAMSDSLRLAAVWFAQREWRKMRVLFRALSDFALGRLGRAQFMFPPDAAGGEKAA